MPMLEKTIEYLSDALVCASGIVHDPKEKQALLGPGNHPASPLAAFRMLCASSGVTGAIDMGTSDIVDLVFNAALGYPLKSGMPQLLSSDDMHSLLGSTTAKSMLRGFVDQAVTYKWLTQAIPVNDLHRTTLYSVSEGADAEEIPQGQPPKLSVLSDSGETVDLRHYGRCVLISQEALSRDQLGLLTSTPYKLGRSLARRLNSLFWTQLLTGNGPVMSETGASLFSVGNGNLLAAAALTQASLGAAYSAMLAMRLPSPDGGDSAIDGAIAPRWLCVGPQNAITAAQLTSYSYQGEMEGLRVGVLVEPMLDTLGAGCWIVAADPASIDAAAFVHLAGKAEPRTSTRVGRAGDQKGIFVDCDIYAQVKFTNFRGFVKTPIV